ncbi:phytyl ester synthase 1, chloroplastic isoform X1 [Ricinus communis]|uniref:phytyl ester synthase 1, chloroplastic isoform X1 n=2 Tax=Ricinus communis TaxID=3988 RepID=UPI00201A5972|nr:phytyl ester synthase 1, chloroplastic isoform X1 [Ricinus communis]
MASVVSFRVSPYYLLNSEIKPRLQVRVQSLDGSDSTMLSSGSVAVNGTSFIGRIENNGALNGGSTTTKKEEGRVLIDGGNGRLKSRVEKKQVKNVSQDFEVLWDDGYGTKTAKDYLEGAKEMNRLDDGPPRWFSPIESGQPLKDSPTLLFLPGLDGVGLGLTLHHKALGKVFEVWCLHIPVYNRTPFEGLVKFVEETVRLEHALFPDKPIYLVGDSFGGCLALAVAARNPKIDFVVILANPATSFGRSQLQPLLPVLEAFPEGLHNAVPYLLSFVMGNPLKMAMVDVEYILPPRLKIEQLSGNLTALLPYLSGLADIIPKDTLVWKLKLLKSAAAYTNSRLHAVKAEVLVLASGADYMLPSADEAKRLKNSLQNCIVRHFKDNGHTLLLEDGINLLTIIKGTGKYRRSRRIDFVSDFLPPSMSEFKRGFYEISGLLRFVTGAALFSTLDDGRIVRGLAGVPNKGPVILVGYHMLMGLELYSLYEEFLREKNIALRGLAHPIISNGRLEELTNEFSVSDWMQVMGALPVTPSNLFKLLSTKSHVLLYPGGAREALHYKGEQYKLFWPDQPEFVRMAARFGATIVPFGSVGEDDIAELALDYNDLMKIPVLNDYIRESTRSAIRIRDPSQGEVGNQELFIPGLLPKVPGRFYFLFGKPIETKGKEELLKDKGYANELYLQVKSEVKRNMDYLLKKRETDPYRSIIDRTLYRALYSPLNEVPAFDP